MDEILEIIITIIVFVIILTLGHITCEYGYKLGQIDAINGKIKYHLIVNEDKTSEWVLIKK